MQKNDFGRIHSLMNENFDLRRKVIPISSGNLEVVELARSTGASAKFTGSGGAIIGTYRDEKMYQELLKLMDRHQIEVFKPVIVVKK
jgi:glucuronokinase